MAKLIKSIEASNAAVKVVKPLNILRKCLNDPSFTTAPAINSKDQWRSLVGLLTKVDDKLVGNYS